MPVCEENCSLRPPRKSNITVDEIYTLKKDNNKECERSERTAHSASFCEYTDFYFLFIFLLYHEITTHSQTRTPSSFLWKIDTCKKYPDKEQTSP